MANILLQNNQIPTGNNSISNLINQAKSLGPSATVFNQLYASNSQFKRFADSMQGKTPEQAFSEHGLNFNQFKPFQW